MEIIFTRRFCMAHRLISSQSQKCATPHGHNEVVTVKLNYAGSDTFDPQQNYAAEFDQLKKDWHEWIDKAVDHAFQISSEDPLIDYFRQHEPEQLSRLLITPGDPTTEVLAALFFSKLSVFLKATDHPYIVAGVTIEETPTNSVTIYAEDLRLFPMLSGDGWWSRADHSINDLTE